jgi:hypothetical protein
MNPSFSGTGSTVAVTTSVTSANGAIVQGSGQQIRIFNDAADPAFFRVGGSAQTAVATDTFVAPGSTEIFSIPPGIVNIGVILTAGTGVFYAQCGNGQ